VAQHYTEAGLPQQAIPYWQQAGQLAIECSALSEVMAHLTKALALLAALRDTPTRARQELHVLTTMGPTLIATKGHTAPEIEQTYTRARLLCEQVGDDEQLFLVLNGLRRLYFVRGQMPPAQECGEQLLAVAWRQGHPAQLLEAHLALAQIFDAQGELLAARAQYEQGLALYDPIRHRAAPALYPRDTAVAIYVSFGQLLSRLGYADQAQEWLEKALILARIWYTPLVRPSP
jgi:tetratricopeptide (TPR) repeat protein